MLTFIPSRHEQTIAVEFDGKATTADAEKLDSAVAEKFGSGEPFNILAVVHDLDGTTLQGVAKGFKVDMKHWKQYSKLALVSDVNYLEQFAHFVRFFPGIEAKHFQKPEIEEAWNWIRQ